MAMAGTGKKPSNISSGRKKHLKVSFGVKVKNNDKENDEDNLIKYTMNGDFEKNIYTAVQMNVISCTVFDPTIYPVEVSLVSFSLEMGIIETLTLLIDPGTLGRPPLGAAFNAKVLSDETGLPLPGSRIFRESHRDYHSIAFRIITMIDRYMCLQEEEYPKKVLYGMNVDLGDVRGGFKWLGNNCRDPDLSARLKCLEFVDLSKLFYSMAQRVNKKLQDYLPPMIQFQLPNLAETQLHKFVRCAYSSRISCPYHCEIAPEKLDKCAKNYILRRVFIILEEFVHQLEIRKCPGHFIFGSEQRFGQGQGQTGTSFPNLEGDEDEDWNFNWTQESLGSKSKSVPVPRSVPFPVPLSWSSSSPSKVKVKCSCVCTCGASSSSLSRPTTSSTWD